ncbi:hypothetical protein [Pseudoxanthomonas sp. USHLN014]|uniref:hypothetical protein n=1 Tax=Pseudoxanthomonas sp. USHLN014 TaxID=3081297 RepID=UPI00301DA95C
MSIVLGATYTDRITGLTGIATGHCKYITGCNQTLVQPKGEGGQSKPEAHWIDDQRLELVESVEVVSLDNGATPGSDRAAPKI